MSHLRPIPLLLFFLLALLSVEGAEEEFSEALLLRPLPDRKVLGHFYFRSRAPASDSNGKHHRVFPKAVAQLVQKFRIKEMELSFTQGRWNYERWGASDPIPSTNAKPPGVELWAVFDVPVNEIDDTWKGLTHALSGLFCSSINFLDSSTSYTSPSWGFNNMSNLRYGALPREAVCTENLTPWLKLLPCRDRAGIASILDRPSIYEAFYHSQRMKLVSTESTGVVLEQTLTVVVQPKEQQLQITNAKGGLLQPSWSIKSLFKNKVGDKCALAKSSNIFLELEKGLVAELEKLGTEEFWSNLGFELTHPPNKIIKHRNGLDSRNGSVLYEYDILNYRESKPIDVGMKWKIPLLWSSAQAPFHASRYLMGSGNERGSIAISMQSSRARDLNVQKDGCMIKVVILQIVPWYVRAYYHTLQFFVDGVAHNMSSVVEKIKVSPSEDKASPGAMELMLKLPCGIKEAVLTLDFDKGFLHIDEYPPDANQGFDIPSATISFPEYLVSLDFLEENSAETPPLLLKLKESNPVRSYTEVLLVPLTTPDFSMPYNVLTFTCTVLALYFGSLLNVLRRRVREEERLLKHAKPGLLTQLLLKISSKLRGKKQESTPTPSRSSLLSFKLLLKVIVVAGAAIVWQLFLNDK